LLQIPVETSSKKKKAAAKSDMTKPFKAAGKTCVRNNAGTLIRIGAEERRHADHGPCDEAHLAAETPPYKVMPGSS
jgi:hypothetical protein